MFAMRSLPIFAAMMLLPLAALAQPSERPSPTGPARSMETLARQAALDRAGFSPGLVDGVLGPKTTFTVREFQRARALSDRSGEFTPQTLETLGVSSAPSTRQYALSAADVADVGGPLPDDWNAKAKLDRLRYESLAVLLAERGHCKVATVEWLNPGVSLNSLRPGDSIVLPNITPDPRPAMTAASLSVDLSNKIVAAHDEAGAVLAMFHCSIAAKYEKRPRGAAFVRKVAFDPDYTFRPEMWPEVKTVNRVLRIPPGPRNPVGLCWIGLSLDGYGIHGTPKPELIGKTGSHGCIRLANWDAVRLGKMIQAGIPVNFVNAD